MTHILGLYEAHLTVANLDRSVEFYRDKLGLEPASRFDTRRVAFFWLGEGKSHMLGLWEVGTAPMRMSLHLAFRLSLAGVLGSAGNLRQNGIEPLDFHGKPADEPDVIGWMPAVSQYFRDPDGHNLEYICILDEPPDADFGVKPYRQWLNRPR